MDDDHSTLPVQRRRDLDDVAAHVYRELRGIAARYLRLERAGHTLQPTALVHEAYLRLADQHPVARQNRPQFVGVAAQMMRRILVDHARKRLTHKRAGGAAQVSLSEALRVPGNRRTDLVALDDALRALEELDPQLSRVVELRYFGGLTLHETAEV